MPTPRKTHDRRRSGPLVMSRYVASVLLVGVMFSILPFEMAAAQVTGAHDEAAGGDGPAPCSDGSPAGDPCEDGCLCACCPGHALPLDARVVSLAIAPGQIPFGHALTAELCSGDFKDDLFHPPRRA